MFKFKDKNFENIVNASEKVFTLIEAIEVEHIGRDIALYTPSKVLDFINWNSRGNNGKVNVELYVANLDVNHPEDKKVNIRVGIKDISVYRDNWYNLNIKTLPDDFRGVMNHKIHNKISNYLKELKESNSSLITDATKILYNSLSLIEVQVILDDNNTKKNALNNIKLLKQIIEDLNKNLENIVEEAKEEVKAELNSKENNYQEQKALRKQGLKLNTKNNITKTSIIKELNNKELSQEQLQNILELIK